MDVAQKPEIIAIRMSGGGGSNKEIDAGTIAEVIGELRMDGNHASECKRKSWPNCETDGSSSNESWS